MPIAGAEAPGGCRQPGGERGCRSLDPSTPSGELATDQATRIGGSLSSGGPVGRKKANGGLLHRALGCPELCSAAIVVVRQGHRQEAASCRSTACMLTRLSHSSALR
jgi:hypothetical protein